MESTDILKKIGCYETKNNIETLSTINNIETLDKLLKDKRVTFNEEDETFSYVLKKPLTLADGTSMTSCIARESSGYELTKLGDLSQSFQVSIDMVAIQNGISSEIIGRLRGRDIMNLTAILGFFS